MPEIELPQPVEGRDWAESSLFNFIYKLTRANLIEKGLIYVTTPEPPNHETE